MVKEVMGIRVLDKLDEIVEPEHSCILVVDMQKDFCYPTGICSKEGADISMIQGMIPRLRKFIDTARNSGLLIVFIKNTSLKNGLSDSPAWLLFKTRKGHYLSQEITMEGTEGHDVIDELKIYETDLVIQKHRSSAFVNTNLDLVLRSKGIKTVIVTGVVTQGCVDSTVRHALFLDYYVVVVSDCVASTKRELHYASVRIMKDRYPVAKSIDLMRVWRSIDQSIA